MITLRKPALLLLMSVIVSSGCAQKPDAPAPKQSPNPENNGQSNDPDHDEDGYPIERNRPVGKGETKRRDDGAEELIIPLREGEREPERLEVAPREKKVNLIDENITDLKSIDPSLDVELGRPVEIFERDFNIEAPLEAFVCSQWHSTWRYAGSLFELLELK